MIYSIISVIHFVQPRWRSGRALASNAGVRGSIPSRDKTGSDSPSSKRSATGVSVMGARRWPCWWVCPCLSRCGTLNNPHCPMAMSAEYMSKFVGLTCTSNGDVSKWCKILLWYKKKTPNQQISKYTLWNRRSGNYFPIYFIDKNYNHNS